MSTARQEPRRQNDDLLQAYLVAENTEESERLVGQILERAAPYIANRLGRRFHVSIEGGRCPLNPDAEDQYNEVNAMLLEKLRKLKRPSAENPIRDLQSYVERIADNAFRNRIREDHKQLRSLKDALRYLLSGRTRHKAFGLWRTKSGQQVAGLAQWRDEGGVLIRSQAYQQLLDDPKPFADAKLPNQDFERMGRAELVDAIFHWLGGPVELDDLVHVMATLQGIKNPIVRIPASSISDEKRSQPDYLTVEAPDPRPTPLAALESKSDMQMVWKDLRLLTLEQRRVILLQAQHDVVEILLRTGVATIEEIAAGLEMAVSEIEELRATGFLSDEQLGHRFRSLTTTIMQQRNRARHKMAEWRKRW